MTHLALPSPGEIFQNKYEIVRLIAKGGMGVVYEAIHRRMRMRVALKILNPEFAKDSEILERFEREARIASSLESAHIAKVLDIDTTPDGSPYMVIELLEGFDLGEELERRGKLFVPESVAYLLEACIPLAAAHAEGIVHRDLKPSNLFVCVKGGKRTLKLLDFGISKVKAEASSPKLTTRPLGTPHYMAPEQIRSEDVDHRADIWALGIMLYEMLVGSVPFGGTAVQAIAAIINPSLPVPTLPATIPWQLARAIRKALEREPSDRFQTIREFASAIAPFAPEGALLPDSLLHAPDPRPSTLPPPSMPSGTLLLEQSMAITLAPPRRSFGVIGIALLLASIAGVVAFAFARSRATERVEQPVVVATSILRASVDPVPATTFVSVASQPIDAGSIVLPIVPSAKPKKPVDRSAVF